MKKSIFEKYKLNENKAIDGVNFQIDPDTSVKVAHLGKENLAAQSYFLNEYAKVEHLKDDELEEYAVKLWVNLLAEFLIKDWKGFYEKDKTGKLVEIKCTKENIKRVLTECHKLTTKIRTFALNHKNYTIDDYKSFDDKVEKVEKKSLTQ